MISSSQNLHRRHLTAEFRRQRVVELRGQGMSLRGIAETIGTSLNTVQRDLESSPVLKSTPDPTPEEPDDEVEDEEVAARPPSPPKVTGRDGKQYAAKKPHKAKKAGRCRGWPRGHPPGGSDATPKYHLDDSAGGDTHRGRRRHAGPARVIRVPRVRSGNLLARN